MKRIIVIGAGPSGMMAAISAKFHQRDSEVVLLEKNNELGRKLKLTGGGRCNVTADVKIETVLDHVPKNSKFLYSCLNEFGPEDIQTFFSKHGLKLKIEDHKRVFPASNNAQDVVMTLRNVLIKSGVLIKLQTNVTDIDYEKQIVKTERLDYHYSSLIIATGGIILPQTGSSGDGHRFALKMGHVITDLKPAEVPLVSNASFIQTKILQGLTFFDVDLTVFSNNKVVKRLTHDLIFTHFGLSGPGALRLSYEVISSIEKNKKVEIEINFLNKFIRDEKLTLLQDLVAQNIPKRLIHFIQKDAKNEQEILDRLTSFRVPIAETRGFKHAFVTNGGVDLKLINPKTMKSKMNATVSFCGEVIDINAYTGGYNITVAFSTGFVAGKYA